MKTKEELNALKKEVENLNKKLTELSEEELSQITAGTFTYEGDDSTKYKLRQFVCAVCDTVLMEEKIPWNEVSTLVIGQMPMMLCPTCGKIRKTVYVVSDIEE